MHIHFALHTDKYTYDGLKPTVALYDIRCWRFSWLVLLHSAVLLVLLLCDEREMMTTRRRDDANAGVGDVKHPPAVPNTHTHTHENAPMLNIESM